jgi:enoyl-CoA hydratase/carnithine racemase
MNTTTTPYVLRDDFGAAAHLTLNRGAQYNPLSLDMISALRTHILEIRSDACIKVVVLKGAGKGFCAGHDLKEMNANRNEPWLSELFGQCSALMQDMLACPKPIIAQVHGAASAAGCQLVATCDLAIATTETRFSLPGVNIGLFCSTPAVAVSRAVQTKHALEMLLTGQSISAQTAAEWGLINAAVPPEELEVHIQRLTEAISDKSTEVLALGKKTFYQQAALTRSDAYTVAGKAMTHNMFLEDSVEGINAFLEKRSPRWRS